MACIRVAPCLASSTFEGACIEKQMPLASMPSSSGVHSKIGFMTPGNRSAMGMTSGKELMALAMPCRPG